MGISLAYLLISVEISQRTVVNNPTGEKLRLLQLKCIYLLQAVVEKSPVTLHNLGFSPVPRLFQNLRQLLHLFISNYREDAPNPHGEEDWLETGQLLCIAEDSINLCKLFWVINGNL